MEKNKRFCKFLAVLMSAIMLFSALPFTYFTASATPSSYEDLELDQEYQKSISYLGTQWYAVTADETQYYKFNFRNQSAEARTGIGLADSFLNLFAGKISVTIYDPFDERVAGFDVKCGYSASISVKFQKNLTYYISVYSTIAGNYRFSVSKLADIGGDTWRTATPIEPSGVTISAIDAKGDEDWFVFYADDVLSYYYYSLESIQSSTLYFYLYEYVEGAGSTPLRSTKDFSVGNNSTRSTNLQLNPGTRYYLCIKSTSDGTGGYVLNAIQSIDAVANEQAQAFTIDRDVEMASSFDGTEDNDWYKFTTADYDAYYHIQLKNNTNSGAYFYLYASDKTELLHSGYIIGGESATANQKLQNNTTYFLKTINYSGNTGSYSLQITTVADTAPDVMESAKVANRDVEIASSFDGTNDNDWYKFTTADYDAYYHIQLKNNTNSGAYFYLYASDKTELLHSGYIMGGESAAANQKLQNNTTYFLKAINYSSNTGSYLLKITTLADAVPDVMENASIAKLDVEIKSSFDGTNDNDWYQFTTADYDAYYHIQLKNNTNSGAYFYLYAFDKTELLHSGYIMGGESATANQKLQNNTTYFLKAINYSSNTGSYSLKITTSPDIGGDSKEDAYELTPLNIYLLDLASSNDNDWFKLVIKSKDKITVSLLNESCSSIYCYCYTARDAEVFSIYGYNKTEYKKETELSSGTYYLKISGGSSGYYTLKVKGSAAADDFECIHTKTYNKDAVAVTCTENGYTGDEYCLACGEIVKEGSVIYAAGHNEITLNPAYAATCTENGYTGDTVCSVCGAAVKTGSIIPATGHNYNAIVKNPTCTQEGFTTHTCSRCGDVYSDNHTAALGHNYIMKTVKLATESENGLKEEICTRCGAKTGKTQELIYTGHITGDINGDNSVNNKDLTRLFQHLSDWDVQINEEALDVNGDGSVNNKDLTRLFQYLSDWDVEIY